MKIAYFSPLPPLKTGIAVYSSHLITYLAKIAEIEIYHAGPCENFPGIKTNDFIANPSLLKNLDNFDEIIYHLGNNPWYHLDIYRVFLEYPRTVVLHDAVLYYLIAGCGIGGLIKEFCYNYGIERLREVWGIVRESIDGDILRYSNPEKYPLIKRILENARQIIVHSKSTAEFIKAAGYSGRLDVVNLIYYPDQVLHFSLEDSLIFRKNLHIETNQILIGVFGFIGPTKRMDKLLSALCKIKKENNVSFRLLIIGEGDSLNGLINHFGLSKNVINVGFVTNEDFSHYLNRVDFVVNLRHPSMGEASATLVQAMSFGKPVIVTNHAWFSELPDHAVIKVGFGSTEVDEIAQAITKLITDKEYRKSIGSNAKTYVENFCSPLKVAGKYLSILNKNSESSSLIDFESQHIQQKPPAWVLRYLQRKSTDLAQHQLLIDVSGTSQNDLKTGIERVARALIVAFLESPPTGYQVEPVYLSNEGGMWRYRYARRYTLGLLEQPPNALTDDVVDMRNGDLLLGVDLSGHRLIEAQASGLYEQLRKVGVSIYFVVFDLLPVQMPDVFPPDASQFHAQWLQVISTFDGAVCISKTVAEALIDWLPKTDFNQREGQPFRIGWFHLGADVINSAATRGLPDNAEWMRQQLHARPSFLMVGTVEPRKGYLQVLAAFTQMWRDGQNINLVIVGKEGWQNLPDNMRRTVPEIVQRLKNHPERNRRLFWLEGVSDEYLEQVYAASTCLIAASEGEGFGLPLIEAAQHQLPIIARDIPIFREVAGDRAFYFSGLESEYLVEAIRSWIKLYTQNCHSGSDDLPWRTWKESVESLSGTVIGGRWHFLLAHPMTRQKALEKHLNLIHASRINMVSHLLPPGDVILDLGGANCPLYKMGYAHRFKKLYLIDLAPDARHEMYKEVVIDPNCDGGEVVIRYGDMTELEDFPDESVDFVWSGQSIEHVSPQGGEKMCRAAFRVLKRGGTFCLDTPNRLLTEIHTRDAGCRFIHPEHCIEYYPKQLRELLEGVGFEIKHAYGVCEMPNTRASGDFCYEDFIYGQQITDNVESGYIQYFHCVKP